MDIQNAPYELIAKHLAHECPEHEEDKLNAWKNKSMENNLLFSELESLWTNCDMDDTTFVIPAKETVWNKINTYITNY